MNISSITWHHQASEELCCVKPSTTKPLKVHEFLQQAEWVKTTGCEVGMALAWITLGFGASTTFAIATIATTESVINEFYLIVFVRARCSCYCFTCHCTPF